MLNAFSTIGMNVTDALSKVSKRVRRQSMIAAAVAATGLVSISQAHAGISDVTGVTVNLTPGFTSFDTESGAGTAASGFTSNKTYNITYLGEDEAVTSVTAAGGTYIPAGFATTTVRRFSGPNTDIIWYKETPQGNANTPNLTLLSSPVANFNQAFSANNLLVGTDNLFVNTGNRANNNTNVERLDTIYATGLTANSTTAFTIFDRGVANQHDSFKIAAITGLDVNGNPSSYGNLISYNLGSWGKTALDGSNNYIVERRDNNIPGDGYHPSDEDVQQTLGGTLLTTNSLAPDGTKIFGYSLFAADTTGTGSQLVNWTNTTYFPTDTVASGTTASTDTGGLDAIGTTAVLYQAVPEPTTASILLIGVAGLMARRPKRTA